MKNSLQTDRLRFSIEKAEAGSSLLQPRGPLTHPLVRIILSDAKIILKKLMEIEK